MASVRATTTLKGHHAVHAELFRDEARRIEALYDSVDPDTGSSSIPDDDKTKHRAFCMNSIISTACFLEATINSLYWEVWDDIRRINDGEDPIHYPDATGFRQNIEEAEHNPEQGQKKLSNRLDHAGIIGKYNIFLDINDFDEFEKESSPAEPVTRVLDIRNELVHFEPRWIQGGDKHYTENEYEIEEQLDGRFDLNPLMPSGNAFFPSQCMSYGCAEWALRVSKGFVRQFSIKIDLQIHPDLPLLY